MTETDFKGGLADLKDLFDKFEKGDLFTLYEIKEGLDKIIKFIPKKIEKLFGDYLGVIRSFFTVDVSMENVDEFIDAGYSLVVSIDSYYKGTITPKDFEQAVIEIKNKANAFVDKNVLHNDKEIYPEGYFDNIVDDEDMLMKFCDELREHMDESQITLIDLEFDSTNQENINKVFRAFHTAKSSSAFLGLKNIEEIAHKMEDMLVLVRDNKLQVTKELIDVIFYGINFFRELTSIIETEKYVRTKIISSYKNINIYSYIDIIKEILGNYHVKKLGEILLEEGKLDKELIETILKKQNQDKNKKFGQIAVEEKIITEDELQHAMQKQAVPVKVKSAVFVKVSNNKLNELIDLVGELVINQSMMRQTKTDSSKINTNMISYDTSYTQLEKITTSIKNIVLSMGMVPVSEIFNKLRVVIRNAANELNKMVNVEIEGESTELDRNVIETIYDPLVHIVRNAVDHGLEDADERVAAGKNNVGKIKIEALHKGNNIEIKIIDDGHGIDRDRVLQKAIEKGMVSAEDASRLDDKEIYNFMFLPGFSTAKTVTELSGRGVGLDVVKRNIDQIHGKVEIRSVKGKYSQFIIKLPLTLAIIDGFVTIINNVKYIFPFNIIEEIIIPDGINISKMEDGQIMLYLRNGYIPVIFAGKTFDEDTYNTDLSTILIIIITYQNKYYGIAVDGIAGKQEIVIKNLNQALNNLRIFSGGTIFGDGTIGFVVDIEEFMEKSKDVIEE
ncbi:MAG TPA: chemotaxis protein CheA [Spirochaetia bacterium]|nr:chemotaxis protein CheA [Spirochaetia bacterium]HBI37542.1 chemotaxis protein CheA [Spirochaetia bacterium]